MSLNGVLNTSKDSLLTYQFAIGLTGSNIANVNTPGYSRQKPVFQTVGSVDVAALRAQLSVNVSDIERVYDKYLENQIVEQTKMLGYTEAKDDILGRIEGIFAEGTGGASSLLDKFWNAWEELSANPAQQSARNALVAAAENFTSVIRRIDGDLKQVVTDTTARVVDTVKEINVALGQIADLNRKIASFGEDDGDANTLKDNRSELLHKLGDMIAVSYIENENGATDVFLPDGHALVLGSQSRQLSVETSSGSGSIRVGDIRYKDDPAVSLKAAIASEKSGRLTAYLDITDEVIPGYQDKLNTFVSSLVSEVNTQHHRGYDANGDSGGVFFEELSEADDDAGDFKVSSDISSNLNKIAASATVNSDGDNAVAIGRVREKLVMSGGTATLNDYYAALVGEIGRDAADAQNAVDYRTSLMTQIKNDRESVSGVSLDEEMMSLMKYQMNYNTAGKLVSTVAAMMDTLLQLVGY